MVSVKSASEIDKMRRAGQIVAMVHEAVAAAITPGVTTLELDRIAHNIILKNNAKPNFLGYNGFPNSICASKNHEVIHGIPNAAPLVEGDIVSIDTGAVYEGYHGDCAKTYAVGKVSAEAARLVAVTRECFYAGVALAQEGMRLSDISSAVQTHAEQNGFFVVRDYVGHGIGSSLHEDPAIPNYGKPGRGIRLSAGMTLAVEPMINQSTVGVRVLKDKWTVVTADGGLSAHYEHTILITKGEAQVLTIMA